VSLQRPLLVSPAVRSGSTADQGPWLSAFTRRRENSQPLERFVASRALTNDHSVPESATAPSEKRPFNAAIDPLLPLVGWGPDVRESRRLDRSGRSGMDACGASDAPAIWGCHTDPQVTEFLKNSRLMLAADSHHY
jgi:hypothetical protein